uniref:Acyltransferase n=1 Tax=Gongylonema pulchrum TaxID=637853 RepID=A0A183EU42_9BILA
LEGGRRIFVPETRTVVRDVHAADHQLCTEARLMRNLWRDFVPVLAPVSYKELSRRRAEQPRPPEQGERQQK